MAQFRSSVFSSVRTAHRPRRWVRRLRLVGLLAVVVVVVGLVSITLLWRYADSRIARTALPALQERGESAGTVATGDGAPAELLNVLVVGTDSREGLTDEQLEALGTTDHGGELTDTVMLVQIASTRDRATILSFPRDLKVEVPGHGTQKVNAVHGLGGANLLVEVIEDYTGTDLDHYVEVSIAGFLDVVDTIGGVEVCLDAPMVDAAAAVDLPAGCQVLDGAAATGFVRARHVADQFGGADDFGRIARQQYFVRQAMRRLTSGGLTVNPFRLKATIDAVAGSLTTDDRLSARDMLRLAESLRDLGPDAVDTRAIPGYWSPQTGYVHAYPEQAEVLLQAIRTGAPLPQVGVDTPEELAPADVEVMILNGEGSEGLAGEVADVIEAAGFAVAGTDNAPDFEVERTRIEVTAATEPLGRLLAAAFPELAIEVVVVNALPRGVDVVVVVGADRFGVEPAV